MSWSMRRIRLVQDMASFQVECIIVDDAHDLNRFTLSFLKELTDNLAASPYGRLVGLGLVTAHSGDVIPLKEIIKQPDEIWRQFYRRMDKEHFGFFDVAVESGAGDPQSCTHFWDRMTLLEPSPPGQCHFSIRRCRFLGRSPKR